MNKYSWIMIINATIIALGLIVLAFFVEDIMPYILASGPLNLLNIIIFSSCSKDKCGGNKKR